MKGEGSITFKSTIVFTKDNYLCVSVFLHSLQKGKISQNHECWQDDGLKIWSVVKSDVASNFPLQWRNDIVISNW